ncbi:esterase FE4-like isoform X2 [Zerene cesonia]|uniref:esterase FE4-like isoform X1 n=1 Tax=Zerene cesonia TaxID=33412 RepID=UPI0018E575CB|nr:esterase FE4-like isoform X1 [Zerene cesonia]XP_038210349.1 esterase FE4-like isoform X2 [Zerene cesonia]
MLNKNKIICILIYVSSTSCFHSEIRNKRPIVTITDGKIKGTVEKIYDGSPYYSFKGIPYAEAPIGKNRFEAPLPVKPWEGIRDAAEHGPICKQINFTTSQPTGSEQCLLLNVYTKSLDTQSKIPVMVFIHGGSYDSGSGNSDMYSPDLIIQHDVILVTINYRLELLGYMSLDIPEVPGNAGMRDQVMALRWVKQNIMKFGGDPDNITIFGESSAGTAVTYLILSPMAQGLFHKAIAQSGVSLQDWAQGRNLIQRAFRAGAVLGKETKDVRELLDFLRSLPASNLTNLNNKTSTQDERYRDLAQRFVPVVEKRFPNIEPFISEDPALILLHGTTSKVPLMLGYNSGEGLTIVSSEIPRLDLRNKNASYLVPSNLVDRLSEEQIIEVGARIKRFYVGNGNFSQDHPESIRDMATDLHFAYNTHRFAYLYSSLQVPVYMYRFNYDTDLNVAKKFTPYKNLEGASHADDLFYLFYNTLNRKIFDSDPKLRKYTYEITKMWTDFAKTGNPTPNDSLGVKWLPYTPSGKEYFAIQQNYTMGSYADQHRMEFWNEVYKEAALPSIG